MNRFTSICRAINRDKDEPLNILSFSTHEGWQSQLAKTGHHFYHVPAPEGKMWDTDYRVLPRNICEIKDEQLGQMDGIDVILSQTMSQAEKGFKIGRQNNIPVVSMMHTLPPDSITKKAKKEIVKQDLSTYKVFITKEARNTWGYKGSKLPMSIIEQVVDENEFVGYGGRDRRVLTVSNDFVNRAADTGYHLWKRVLEGVDKDAIHIVGKTPGLSQVASSFEELVGFYQNDRVYFNPSTHSTFPMTILEAMSTGMPVVSTVNEALSEFAENGKNGIWSNDPEELKDGIGRLLDNEMLCKKMGNAGREIVVKRFGIKRFIKQWNKIFKEVLVK